MKGTAVRRNARYFVRHPETLPLQLSRLTPLRRLTPGGGTRPDARAHTCPPAVEPFDVGSAVVDLRTDGFAAGLELLPDAIGELTEFASRAGRPGVITGTEDPHDIECDAVHSLLDDPTLWAIARRYLGAEPAVLELRMWWTAASTTAERRFHFDCDDWRTVKFLFYLTDVDESSHPHRFVRGSHRRHPVRAWFSPVKWQELHHLHRHYGPDAVVAMTGPAGTGFAIDPYGFHSASDSGERPRLTLAVQFAASFRGRPTKLVRAHRDRLALWSSA